MTYNPNMANPFQENNKFTEWNSNNLILKDQKLRYLAGVDVLDSDVSDVFNSPQFQYGGAGKGIPFHMDNYGSPQAINRHTQSQSQNGGGVYPRGYFDNYRLWN